MKIRGIEEHFPKMLTPTQKSLVDRKLTLAALQNGWSYSSLQRPSVGRFHQWAMACHRSGHMHPGHEGHREGNL